MRQYMVEPAFPVDAPCSGMSVLSRSSIDLARRTLMRVQERSTSSASTCGPSQSILRDTRGGARGVLETD